MYIKYKIDHTTQYTWTQNSKVNTYAYTHIESTTCIAKHKQAQQSMKCFTLYGSITVGMRVYVNVWEGNNGYWIDRMCRCYFIYYYYFRWDIDVL